MVQKSKKTRPAIVINSNAIGILPIKLVAPITDWKERYVRNLWHIKLEPNTANGLNKESCVDVLQLRGVDTQRFIRKLGVVAPAQMSEIAIAIVAVIEAEIP